MITLVNIKKRACKNGSDIQNTENKNRNPDKSAGSLTFIKGIMKAFPCETIPEIAAAGYRHISRCIDSCINQNGRMQKIFFYKCPEYIRREQNNIDQKQDLQRLDFFI